MSIKIPHSKSKIILLVLIIFSSLLIQAQSGTGTIIYMPIVAKNSAPLYSTSYYMQNKDPSYWYAIGCQTGSRDAQLPDKQDSVIILDIGKMWVDTGVYGVRAFANPYNNYNRDFLTFPEMEAVAKNFATGYWVCSANDNQSQLTLGLGTNNFDKFNTGNPSQDNLRALASDFGRNWAAMINRLNEWGLQTGYSSQILFTGAIDIEWDSALDWNTPFVTRGWVDAFDNNDQGKSIFFNYGACIGCPIVPNLSWKYSTSMPWTQADVWYVSWGSKPAFSIPEIYRNDGHLAKQWAAVSKYGSLYQASRIVFSGVMTQWQACQQRGGSDPTCATLDNTPAEGWSQLVNAINGDAYTASPAPVWSTDIKWQYK